MYMSIINKTFNKHLNYLTPTIDENKNLALSFVKKGNLTQEKYNELLNIDPSPSKKYVGWLAKQYIANPIDMNTLRNTIEEYDVFVKRGTTNIKDINNFKTFDDLQREVNRINDTGEDVSNKELENDYETIIDDNNILVMCPHTHEASRKLGLTIFSYRDCGDGRKDSAWCTTYKAPDHFNNYYYTNNVTFYYILIKNEELYNRLKQEFPSRGNAIKIVALAVLDKTDDVVSDDEELQNAARGYQEHYIDAYDATDSKLSAKEIKKFLSIIGIR